MVNLRLLRHGRTASADARRYSGWSDEGLTAEGRLGVAAIGLPDGTYDGIWASDLRRCVETAQILGLEPRVTSALREFDFGDLEGLRWDDLDDTTQAALLVYDDFAAPAGETVPDFARRVDDFVEALPDGHHLVITHGGVINHLLRRVGRTEMVDPAEWVDVEVSRR